MKKHLFKSFALIAMLFSAMSMSAATQYCDVLLEAADGDVKYSLYHVSGNTYGIQVVPQDGMALTGIANPNIGVNQSAGAGITIVKDLWTISNNVATAIFQTASETSVPTNFFTAYICFNKTGGKTGRDLVEVTIPASDIDWTATCGLSSSEGEGGEDTDTETPVLESVELFGAAQTFVWLTPTVTDDKGVTSYIIAKSGGTETEVTPDATTGQIKISPLTIGTTYTYSVKAKDEDGNVSNAKEITFSTLDNVFCEEEVLPNTTQEYANQKITFTAKKVSDTETYLAISSSTSTLTKISTVTFYNNTGETGTYGGGVLPEGYVLKDGWTWTDNTLSKTVTWTTYPTAPFRASINASREKNSTDEKALINVLYTMDVSNTCGEDPVDPTPEPEETIIAETYFAPNWTVDPTSSATYNAETGAITVDLKSQFYGQWQAQVKVKHEVDFSADKYYQFSAKFRANTAVDGVTIKVDDNNGMIFENASINLPANEDFTYTSAIVKGVPGNNKIIVFDFGYASPCQIAISDILLQEVEKPADTEKPVLHSATLVEGSVTHNSAVLAVSATDNVEVVKYHIVDATKGYDKTFAPVDGKITLTDLTPSTTYNFIVTAIDASDNESENSISVSCSTIALLYCDFPTGHEKNANFGDVNGRILLSLLKVSSTHIRVIVKSAEEATKNLDRMYIEAAGANPHATTVGGDVASSDIREMSADIHYPTAPEKYNFMIQWSNPDWNGTWQVNINDVLESNLCPLPTDDEKPVMVSAALVEGSVTHNTVVLTVSATDNDEVANYHVIDATNGYDATIAPVGNQITLTGLTPSTSYNFTVSAVDMAGNESDNSKTVSASTTMLLYCDFPTGHEKNANFGDVNGRILLSLLKVSSTHIRVIVKSAAEATNNLDRMYIEAAGANPHATTVGGDVASSDMREMSADIHYPTAPEKYNFMIQWSHPAWNGSWQVNINDVLESNLCPLPTDDEAPVMVSASLVTGSETYNSAVLTVSATDNDEVANYHVVDAANNYNKTIAPVGNQITLTDLTPSTTYNFTVTALDLAGNESENSKTVAVSTHKLEYCEWIIGSENRTDWTDANRLCLLTISKITDKQLLVVAKPVSGANKLDFLQVQADGASHQTVTSPAADELSIVLDFANTVTEIPLFRILWSNEDVVENWMTDLKNVKASYLCPHVELGESVDLSKLDLSAGVTTDVKITRKFVKGSGKWNTLSLPFGLDATDIATAFGAAKVVELSGATLVTSTDIDLSVSNVSEIVAGKPYLIQIPASYVPAVIKNITLSNTVTAQETATANGLAKMVSVLTPIAFDDAAGGIRFFLNTNGKLSYRSTTNGIMNPYRAYFVFPHINDPATAAQVRARVVFNENEATGLDQIVAPEGETIKAIVNGQLVIIRGGEMYNVQGQKL